MTRAATTQAAVDRPKRVARVAPRAIPDVCPACGHGISIRLLTVDDLSAYLQVHVATIYRDVRAGTFPRPMHIGTLSRWRETDVAAWLAAKAEQATRPDAVEAASA